jgi:hypothetical protein
MALQVRSELAGLHAALAQQQQDAAMREAALRDSAAAAEQRAVAAQRLLAAAQAEARSAQQTAHAAAAAAEDRADDVTGQLAALRRMAEEAERRAQAASEESGRVSKLAKAEAAQVSSPGGPLGMHPVSGQRIPSSTCCPAVSAAWCTTHKFLCFCNAGEAYDRYCRLICHTWTPLPFVAYALSTVAHAACSGTRRSAVAYGLPMAPPLRTA